MTVTKLVFNPCDLSLPNQDFESKSTCWTFELMLLSTLQQIFPSMQLNALSLVTLQISTEGTIQILTWPTKSQTVSYFVLFEGACWNILWPPLHTWALRATSAELYTSSEILRYFAGSRKTVHCPLHLRTWFDSLELSEIWLCELASDWLCTFSVYVKY